MQEWSESAKIAINVIIFAAIVSIMVVMQMLGRQIMNASYENRQMVQQLQEYREYNQYDNRYVRSTDIVSLLLKNRGSTEVVVKAVDGETYTWSSTQKETNYTSEEITAKLSIKSKYYSTLVFDGNGSISQYCFTEEV